MIKKTLDAAASTIAYSAGDCDDYANALFTATEDPAFSAQLPRMSGKAFLPAVAGECVVAGAKNAGVIIDQWNNDYSGVSANKFSMYDPAVGVAYPLFIAVWDKSDLRTNVVTSMTCIPITDIVAGSRNGFGVANVLFSHPDGDKEI